jgi:hypothetical protein
MYKIIGADQKEYGPIAGEQVRQWIVEGRLNSTSKIQVEGSGVWKLLRDLPEFAELLPPPPAPIVIHPAQAAPQANLLASWSLGTGIAAYVCCCIPIFAPTSIVLGAMALSQLKQNPNQTGRGFAIAGIILGSVFLALTVVGFVIRLLFPELVPNLPNGFPR